MFDDDSGNHGQNNYYWYPAGEDGALRFAWQQPMSSLEEFSGTPGDRGGRYLARQDRDAALQSWGLRLTPDT
jgi:hypothetical protein